MYRCQPLEGLRDIFMVDMSGEGGSETSFTAEKSFTVLATLGRVQIGRGCGVSRMLLAGV